jgi:glycine cleavage system H lipoate-binding protein
VSQPESRLVKRCKKWLDDLPHSRWVKIHGGDSPYQEVGISDILGCYLGRFVAIEFKTPGGELSRRQKRFLEEVVRAGGYALVATSLDQVKELIREIDQEVS